MFGVLRIILALMVVVFHLYSGRYPLGPYAVYGFFIISGYLMTYIMHETYGYSIKGRYSFAANRFLRLYPQYWAATALSITLIFFLGENQVKAYHPVIYFPDSIFSIFSNFTIIFQSWIPSGLAPRLVPAAWTLTSEIFFYVLICIGVSKNFYRVKLWLALSVCYVIWTFLSGHSFVDRYAPIAAVSLPFSIGSAIYFSQRNSWLALMLFKLRLTSLRLFLLFIMNCFVWQIFPGSIGGSLFIEVGFYLNILIFSLLVLCVAAGNDIFNISKKLDQAIGDFSYPIYVLHAQVGLLLFTYIAENPGYALTQKGFLSLIFSIALILLVSVFFIFTIDKPIQTVRKKIKLRNR